MQRIAQWLFLQHSNSLSNAHQIGTSLNVDRKKNPHLEFMMHIQYLYFPFIFLDWYGFSQF